jgi:lipopolysaccharide/colanic/teichoic acid biosynthesis glycosyltransferase
MAKRAFDLALSLIGLALLAPLLAVIAVLIVVDSGRPVLFRQERVGRHGRLFRIAKFRTMFVDAPTRGPAVTKNGDARITRIGAWLRRTKLDELPQLYNVAKGEMSLVGPRPEVARYVQYYPEESRRIVFSVRPGITDEAAIQFSNESELLTGAEDPERVYVRDILPRKIALYVEYVRNQSVAGDLRLILRTLDRMIARR